MSATGLSGSAAFKAIVIALIVLVLLAPLLMLQRLVEERTSLRQQAYDKVANGWGGALTVGGPVIVVPTEFRVIENSVTRTHRHDLYLLPKTLDVAIESRQEPEPRYVGIYAVPVFIANVKISGAFDLTTQVPQSAARYADRTILWQQARLRLPVSELRSLRQLTAARFGGADVVFSPAGEAAYGGLEAPLPLTDATSGARDFTFDLRIAGSREVSVLPLGSTTAVKMRSDWPHPSFQGAFLPAERTVTDQGFDATWQVLELNRPYGSIVSEGEADRGVVLESTLGVGFYQAIDVYQRGERAIKYALVFIALTFMTIFAWEHVARLRMHPLQYLLVGLALSIFYLLLIALSEHVAFVIAYWIAAFALTALIGVYLAGALKRRQRGAIAAAALTGVYGVLYALVISESYSLLMGAIVLFVALAAVMIVTRRVDWYGSGAPREEVAT